MNPIVWFEIYVDDIERAKDFYQRVFQVELSGLTNPAITATPGLEMWSFPQNFESDGAGGAICKMEGVTPGGMGTLVYFSCEDCAVEQARVAEYGGKILKEKMALGEYGFMSMCQDPDGNMVGLHSMK